MILIIQGSKVVGTATDAYNGPEQFITAPADFDITRMSDYVFANGAVSVTPSGLDWTKAQQIAGLTSTYLMAVIAPVSYTTVPVAPAITGVTKSYQADQQSVANLQAAIAGCSKAQATPTGFYWVAADNTQVPFSFADLQGLAAAMFAQGAAAFQHLQTLKAQVNSATTSTAVQAVVW